MIFVFLFFDFFDILEGNLFNLFKSNKSFFVCIFFWKFFFVLLIFLVKNVIIFVGYFYF